MVGVVQNAVKKFPDILTGSLEIAVSVHAQYKFSKNADNCSPIAEICIVEMLVL